MDTGTQVDARNRRQRVDDAQIALDRAHADLATQKGKAMRLLSEVGDQNTRVENCAQVIGKAEEDMQNALAYQDPPPPLPSPAAAPRESDADLLHRVEQAIDGKTPLEAREILTNADLKHLQTIVRWRADTTDAGRAQKILDFEATAAKLPPPNGAELADAVAQT